MSWGVGVVFSASVNINKISRMLSQWKNKQTTGDLSIAAPFLYFSYRIPKDRTELWQLLLLCPHELWFVQQRSFHLKKEVGLKLLLQLGVNTDSQVFIVWVLNEYLLTSPLIHWSYSYFKCPVPRHIVSRHVAEFPLRAFKRSYCLI